MLKFLKYTVSFLCMISLLFMQFGKNIVQYDKFDWSYIKTEHFDISDQKSFSDFDFSDSMISKIIKSKLLFSKNKYY